MAKREYLINARGDTPQKEIAEKCGLSAPAYCQIECGQRQTDMTIGTLKRISDALGVPFSKLVKAEMQYINARGER